MTNSHASPSKVRIEQAILYSYDRSVSTSLNGIITEINFSQSLEAAAFIGSIKVQDNIGRLENFPLRGEEKLQLTVVANDDPDRKINLDLQIYRIDNLIFNEANDGVNYYMHFVSRISFEASKRRIIESLRVNGLYPSASLAARRMFSKYFSRISNINDFTLPFAGQGYRIGNTERNFILQPSEGVVNGIIPNYTPAEAMYFLSTRAFINQNFTSCSFRFFETLDDFYFVSDEFLIKSAVDQNEVLKLYYGPQVSKDVKDLYQKNLNVERIDYPVRVDSAADMYSGGYSNVVIEIDFTRREFTSRYFNYLENSRRFLDMNGRPRTEESYIHTEKYMQDTFTEENAKRFLIYRHYIRDGDISGSLATNQYFAEIVSRRTAYQHHLNATSINVAIKGRLDIRPGRVVNLEVIEMSADSQKILNPQLSGNYLVYSTEHSLKMSEGGEDIFTNARLAKYDWST